ncbi:hypothetical protein Tco_1073323, partial [Tanacetum coccineum]
SKQYGDYATGVAPGIKSMRNSTCRRGGNPDRSSGNTSGKSHTIGMSSSFRSLVFIFVRIWAIPSLAQISVQFWTSIPKVISAFTLKASQQWPIICSHARTVLAEVSYLLTLPTHRIISRMMETTLGLPPPQFLY